MRLDPEFGQGRSAERQHAAMALFGAALIFLALTALAWAICLVILARYPSKPPARATLKGAYEALIKPHAIRSLHG